ncbi:Spo0E family sporulation regulatory protein-aspartic acid phosphatase [Anaerobacillus sp. MEB173]|uniref:Spo0E family sporulation regulatory protein-aspartic acid phosphatase n=1 Tax=Anaerobacillus sp. MEB173 TaxID=3383345 RepID=UPI003F91CDA1
MINFNESNDCLEQIEVLRKRMISAALLYGMNHPTVLKYSQEIDQYHNQMLFVTKNIESCPTY